MAFGKKKKIKDNKNTQQPKVVNKVPLSQNPLYPPKKESAAKEVGTAIGVAAGCLLLCGVIISNFSYAATGYPSYDDDYYYESSNETEETEGFEEMSDEEKEDSQENSFEDIEVDEEENAEEEVQEEAKADPDYIIADSDRRYISQSELSGFTAEQCSRARNEIYARHGRRFQDQNLQNYFNSKSWYNGTIEPGAFTESMLNEYEKANASTILSYEKAMGYK